ncbi:antitoxin [Nocardioides sp. LHD-245]|uniref:antitoxin n=1 Tax=Nocardioides sp. LHD-245 TaxID=3051387 RepID=UPI0027DEFCB3|nr:antitoxin [Nocardioides sp. LHD-245]
MGFLDKLRGAKDTVADKVGETVDKHGDKIESGLDKAAGFVDDKTGGKYHDKIENATGKAKDALGKLDGDEPGPEQPPGGDIPPSP